MMMAVGFAIGRDMNEPGMMLVAGKNTQQTVREIDATFQKVRERHFPGNGPVVKKQMDFLPRGQRTDVSHLRVHSGVFDGRPFFFTDLAHPGGLVRGEDRKTDTVFGEDLQRPGIDRGFGEPHPLGLAAETVLKIPDPPEDLRALIARVGQRHDHMIVHLRDRRAVAGEPGLAFLVRRQYILIIFRRVAFHPGQKRWAEVKTHRRVIINHPGNFFAGAEDAAGRVRRVTFSRDPLVPIVVGMRGVLQLDFFEPRIFPRRLVKMSVDTNITVHHT